MEHTQNPDSAPHGRAGRRPFLTASWSNLLLVSYPVDAALLDGALPPGCTLDEFEGRAMVSLVAFDFLGARVLGVRWPGLANFPEVNLRYYVRMESGGRSWRGVAFVRELVPSRLIAWVARTLYNEPYVACPMFSRVESAGHGAPGAEVRMHHEFRIGGSTHTIGAVAGESSSVPPPDSPEHWFKEHQWGFGRDRRGGALAYEVRHPIWRVRELRSWSVGVDFSRVYGEKWGFLADAEPLSVVWAVGSEIEVYPHGRAGVGGAGT